MDNRIIWLYLIKGQNLILNTPKMPLTGTPTCKDSQEMYKVNVVSYGQSFNCVLLDGKVINFVDN